MNFYLSYVFGAEILQKSERDGPRNTDFFEKRKTEGIRTDTWCKRWVFGVAEEPEKGGHQSGRYPYVSWHVSAPPGLWSAACCGWWILKPRLHRPGVEKI